MSLLLLPPLPVPVLVCAPDDDFDALLNLGSGSASLPFFSPVSGARLELLPPPLPLPPRGKKFSNAFGAFLGSLQSRRTVP